MIDREVRILMRKEWRQLVHKKSALASGVILPMLMLGFIPALLTVAARAPTKSGGQPAPVSFGLIGELGEDPSKIAGAMLPFFVAMVGLIVPMMMATYLLINERERRTLELYVTLPVRIQQIVAAKLIATVLVSAAITVPFVALDMILLPILGAATFKQVALLPLLLLSSIALSTSASLLMSLLAKDFRTANNIGGALLGPMIILSLLGTGLLPGGFARPIVLSGVYLAAAWVFARVMQKKVTVERLLS